MTRLVDPDYVNADRVGAARHGLLQGFIQVVPMEEKLRCIGLALGTVVDRLYDKFPGAGENGTSQRHHIADLESVLICELAPDHTALAIEEERLQVFRGNPVFRIERKVAHGIHSKLRKKILLRDIDSSEPIGVAHADHPANLTDALCVSDWQGEYERNRVAGNQPGSRSVLGTGEPGFHHRAQQTKRQDGHENT